MRGLLIFVIQISVITQKRMCGQTIDSFRCPNKKTPVKHDTYTLVAVVTSSAH